MLPPDPDEYLAHLFVCEPQPHLQFTYWGGGTVAPVYIVILHHLRLTNALVNYLILHRHKQASLVIINAQLNHHILLAD